MGAESADPPAREQIVQSWPATSIVTADLELRHVRSEDLEPFLRSIDDEVVLRQGFTKADIERYRAVVPLLGGERRRARLRRVIGRIVVVTRSDELIGQYGLSPDHRAIRQIEANGAQLVRTGPHRLPNGTVVDGRWYEHAPTSPTVLRRPRIRDAGPQTARKPTVRSSDSQETDGSVVRQPRI